VIGVHTLVVVMFACLLYGYFIEPRWIDVHTVTLQTPLLKSATFRIVQISDLHCGQKPRNETRTVESSTLSSRTSSSPQVLPCCPQGWASCSERFLVSKRRSEVRRDGQLRLGRWPHLDIPGDCTFRVLDRETVILTKARTPSRSPA
jgi:hypothetical protein